LNIDWMRLENNPNLNGTVPEKLCVNNTASLFRRIVTDDTGIICPEKCIVTKTCDNSD